MNALMYCAAIGVAAVMFQGGWWLGRAELEVERARKELAESHAERLIEDARRAREMCVPCGEPKRKHGRLR